MSTYTRSVRTASGSYKRVAGRPVIAAFAAATVTAATVVAVIAIVLSSRGSAAEPSMPVQTAPALVAPGLTISRLHDPYTTHTVYIVGSEQQAASVAAGINDANAIRDNLQLPPMLDEVVVVSSDEEAAVIVARENAINTILQSSYRVENRVVDLRQ